MIYTTDADKNWGLVRAEGDDGIDFCGAARGKQTRQRGSGQQNCCDDGKSKRVGGLHTEEQALEDARQSESAKQANHDSHRDLQQSLAEHHFQNV